MSNLSPKNNIIKIFVVVILIVCFGHINSQNFKCLDYKFYKVLHDVVEINIPIDSLKENDFLDLKSDSLQLIVFPDSYIDFPKWSSYSQKGIDKGFKIVLVNNSSNDINLYNMDGRVIIYRQVFHNNEWRNVKSYNENQYPICGNSFLRKNVIKSDEHYIFAAPCIKGEVYTKFRMVLYTKPINETLAVYSNEFYSTLNTKLIE